MKMLKLETEVNISFMVLFTVYVFLGFFTAVWYFGAPQNYVDKIIT